MKLRKSGLSCFSPQVMAATFVIEAGLLLYTVIRYKLNKNTRLIALALLLLATFQLAEFGICGKNVQDTLLWSRIGYVAITLLPPLGLHIIYRIINKRADWLLGAAYGTALFFVFMFGFSNSAFAAQICTSNYAIFHLIPPLGGFFFAYYYGWLFTGIGLSLYYYKTAKKPAQTALFYQAIGYLSFLIPTGVINMINPETMNGIPSIMCGFAVLYALILTFGILPKINLLK
jgi:hypothetical protein